MVDGMNEGGAYRTPNRLLVPPKASRGGNGASSLSLAAGRLVWTSASVVDQPCASSCGELAFSRRIQCGHDPPWPLVDVALAAQPSTPARQRPPTCLEQPVQELSQPRASAAPGSE